MLQGLEDRSVGAIITDPPFHVSVGRAANWMEKRGIGEDPWTSKTGDMTNQDEIIEWTRPIVKETGRTIRLGGSLVIMGGTQSLLAWDLLTGRFGFQWMAELVVLWNTGKPRARNFGGLHTRIVWYVRSGLRHAWNHPLRSVYSNVLVCSKVSQSDRVHPTQKPVGLTNFLVSLLSTEEDLIVDPFCGSGSTLVSAEQCGRPWIGCDLDERYVKIARQRAMMAEHEEVEPIYLWINGRLEEI